MNNIYYPNHDDLKWWMDYLSRSNMSLKLFLPVVDDNWSEYIVGLIDLLKFPYYGKDVYFLAANLFYKIIKGHNYIDSNKRSAVVTTYLFLLMNNYYLLPTLDIRKLAKQTASTKGNSRERQCLNKIYKAFKEHSKTLGA